MSFYLVLSICQASDLPFLSSFLANRGHDVIITECSAKHFNPRTHTGSNNKTNSLHILCGQKESETSSVMLCFPTILPTNRLNPHNPNWYPVKLLNSKKPSNPLQHKKLEDLYWHEWARHKSIHGFLVRMRSAVRIRPAAPKSPVFYRKQDFFFTF